MQENASFIALAGRNAYGIHLQSNEPQRNVSRNVSSSAALFHTPQALLQAGGNALDGQADRLIRLRHVDAVVHQRPPDTQGSQRPAQLGLHPSATRKAVEWISLALAVKAPE